MIIYYGIDIEWIKKVFYLPSEEWMISLVVVFFSNRVFYRISRDLFQPTYM